MNRIESSQTVFPRRNRRAQPPRKRAGLIAFELFLMLPILLIFLAAVVEFGLILSTVQSVESASRYGAKLVSERPSGVSAVNFANSGNLRSAINRQLRVAGMQRGVCRLKVEHNGPASPNNGGDAPSQQACDCAPPATSLPLPRTAIRLTICVPLEGNVPDLLGTFGFSLQGRVIQQSAVFRLE
jgi:hypothetical protein